MPRRGRYGGGISAGSLTLVFVSAALAVGVWLRALVGLRAALRSGCPVCRGLGTLRVGDGVVRCDDCAGTGSPAEGLPDTVPAHWLG